MHPVYKQPQQSYQSKQSFQQSYQSQQSFQKSQQPYQSQQLQQPYQSQQLQQSYQSQQLQQPSRYYHHQPQQSQQSVYKSYKEVNTPYYANEIPSFNDVPMQYPSSSSSSSSPFDDLSHGIVKGMPQYTQVKQRVEEATRLKSKDIQAARRLLENLIQEYPNCHLSWMELSRLEMEQGNIRKCRDVIIRGLSYLPHNEALLEKRIKVEERLRNEKGVIECATIFLEMNNSRCVKSIVDAAIVVAKLGYGYQASKLFQLLVDHHLFTQGGVTLDYIRFVFKTEDYNRGLNLLLTALQSLNKYSPIWFFTFSVLEQNHTIRWSRDIIATRPNNDDLSRHIQKALKCLDSTLHWKVFYIAAQAQLRSFTHIRLWARTKKRYLSEYIQYYPQVIRVCFEYLKKCVDLCPDNYKWKVWLLAGRVQALAGTIGYAIQVLFFLLYLTISV